MRILLIEDDPSVAAGVVDALETASTTVEHARDAATGLAAAAGSPPDLVLLDLGLPDRDGLEVCRELRSRGATPIIVLSARGEEADRVIALELGADDYLTKPFGMRELQARIRALLRRTTSTPGTAEGARAVGPLEIDPRSRRVTLGGEELHFTPTEFDLLLYLADDAGAVLRRPDILRDVWKTEWYGASKTLDAHVAAIRRKLGDPGWIRSVRGVGFRLDAPR